MLTCNKCGFHGDEELFIKDKRAANGRRNKCKECERARLREYQRNNRDKVNEANRKSYEKHRDKRLEKQKRYAESHKEIRSIQAAIRYQNNKEEYLKKCAEYRRKNPQQNKKHKAIRRDREKSLPHTLTSEEYEEVLETFNNLCTICGDKYEHLDHFIPVRTGVGGTIKQNVSPMCASCNLSKSGRNPFVWASTLDENRRSNFDSLVTYLTNLNGFNSEIDYEMYVNGCF